MNSRDVGSSSSSSAKGHAPFHRQTSHPMAARHDKKVSRLHSVESRSQQKGADIIDLTSDGDDLTLVPASTWFGKKSKRIPSPNLGFLIQVRKSPKNPYYPKIDHWKSGVCGASSLHSPINSVYIYVATCKLIILCFWIF